MLFLKILNFKLNLFKQVKVLKCSLLRQDCEVNQSLTGSSEIAVRLKMLNAVLRDVRGLNYVVGNCTVELWSEEVKDEILSD